MNTYKLIATGTATIAFGMVAAYGQTTAGQVVGDTANVVKGAASSTVAGAKGLLSMPGKAMNFGTDALPDLSAGTQEFGLSGNVGFQDDISYNLNLSYGYFFKDNWEVGFNANISGIEDTFGLGVGIFTEYNFDLDSKWVPFIGGSIGLASLSVEDSDSIDGDTVDINSLDIAGVLGVKYFIREDIALSFAVDFSWNPNDALDTEFGSNVNIGTRFYF